MFILLRLQEMDLVFSHFLILFYLIFDLLFIFFYLWNLGLGLVMWHKKKDVEGSRRSDIIQHIYYMLTSCLIYGSLG